MRERGRRNGASVDIIDESDLRELLPLARSASGRAIWSPDTAVVKPKAVVECLEKELLDLGVEFIKSARISNCSPSTGTIRLDENQCICYGHLFNCAGLHADEFAKMYGLAKGYKLMPFKGLYWQIKTTADLRIERNLYPVPDLNVPFLGIHMTPSADNDPVVTIGPTATPAFGRENYSGSNGIDGRIV